MTAYSNYNPSLGSFVQSLGPGMAGIFVWGVPTNVPVATVANSGASRSAGIVTFTTTVAHNFMPGYLLTAFNVGSVNNTQFGGLYQILTVPSTTTLTAMPLQEGPVGSASASGNVNQPNDTGGGGVLNSIAGEQPVIGTMSIPVAIGQKDSNFGDADLSLEIQFSGAPGTFEVDLMEADTNLAALYQIANGGNAKISSVSATNFTARLDLTNFVGRFAAVTILTRGNAVNMIAKLSR